MSAPQIVGAPNTAASSQTSTHSPIGGIGGHAGLLAGVGIYVVIGAVLVAASQTALKPLAWGIVSVALVYVLLEPHSITAITWATDLITTTLGG